MDLKKINRQRKRLEESHGIVLQTRDEDQEVREGEGGKVHVAPVKPRVVGKTTYGGRLRQHGF